MHLLLGHRQLAIADVLVGVEADLLEADHPARDPHFAVAGHCRTQALVVEAFERLDLHVFDGVGVIAALDLLDVGLALVVLEALDMVQAALVDVDGLFVEAGERRREGDLPDDLGVVAVIDDNEVIAGNLAQADCVGGIGFRCPVPGVAGPVEHAGLF